MSTIVGFGDSWMYGTGLVPNNDFAPAMDFSIHDQPAIVKYRHENCFLHRLGTLLGHTNIINKGVSGSSNDAIYRDLLAWLAANDYLINLLKGKRYEKINWFW